MQGTTASAAPLSKRTGRFERGPASNPWTCQRRHRHWIEQEQLRLAMIRCHAATECVLKLFANAKTWHVRVREAVTPDQHRVCMACAGA